MSSSGSFKVSDNYDYKCKTYFTVPSLTYDDIFSNNNFTLTEKVEISVHLCKKIVDNYIEEMFSEYWYNESFKEVMSVGYKGPRYWNLPEKNGVVSLTEDVDYFQAGRRSGKWQSFLNMM